MNKQSKKNKFAQNGKPSEKFIYVCDKIARPLSTLGFKYRKSNNDIVKKADDLTYSIEFVRSRKLNPVTFAVDLVVKSEILRNWRETNKQNLDLKDEIIRTSLISTTKRAQTSETHSFRTVKEGEEIAAEISRQIKNSALPFLKRFENIPKLVQEVKQKGFLPHREDLIEEKYMLDFVECFTKVKEKAPKKEKSITSYQEELRSMLADDGDYEQHKPILEDYKEYLESLVREDTSNARAVGQLAAVYAKLYEPSEKAMLLIEATLTYHDSKLTKDEKVELYTNLAMLYDYDNEQSTLEQIDWLEEAIALEPNIAHPYNALGIVLLEQEQPDKAKELFDKATKLSSATNCRYNHALVYYYEQDYYKAAELLETIIKDWRFDQEAFQAYYTLGFCKAKLGKEKEVLKIADDLANSGIVYNELSILHIADLYYLCGEYKKQNILMEKYLQQNDLPMENLPSYFYSLGQIKQDAKNKLFEFIEQKQLKIEELEQADFSDIGQKVQQEYIDNLEEEIEKTNTIYCKVIENNIKPELTITLPLIRKCYFIDCPIHS